MPLTLPLPEAVQCLLDQVLTGGDAVLDGAFATAALDRAAALLAAQRCRVLRASAAGPGGLGLPGLMAQIAGRSAPGAEDGDNPEQGAQALTRLDDGCDRVVLLLDGAGDLPAVTLRYLQLTCRTSAALRLVVVGRPDALDGPEFGYLRGRLSARPVLAPRVDGAAGLAVGAALPGLESSPLGRALPPAARAGRMRPAAAALGMVGCLALGILIGQQAPASSAAAPPGASASSTAASNTLATPAAAVEAAPPALMATGTAPLAATASSMVVPSAPAPDAAAPIALTASPPASTALAANAPTSTAPASTALAPTAPSPRASPFLPPVVVDAAAAVPPPAPGLAVTGAPAMAPARAATPTGDLLPVPPTPPLNRPGSIDRQGGSRRRDYLVAASRPASPPRSPVMRPLARGRSYGRAYDTWASRWDDPQGPALGWQSPGWQAGDRGWPPPRAYPGDAYAGRDYPYAP